jgi:hypothetical protein
MSDFAPVFKIHSNDTHTCFRIEHITTGKFVDFGGNLVEQHDINLGSYHLGEVMERFYKKRGHATKTS